MKKPTAQRGRKCKRRHIGNSLRKRPESRDRLTRTVAHTHARDRRGILHIDDVDIAAKIFGHAPKPPNVIVLRVVPATHIGSAQISNSARWNIDVVNLSRVVQNNTSVTSKYPGVVAG